MRQRAATKHKGNGRDADANVGSQRGTLELSPNHLLKISRAQRVCTMCIAESKRQMQWPIWGSCRYNGLYPRGNMTLVVTQLRNSS